MADLGFNYQNFKTFNITQRIMESLIQRAYHSFKNEYPNEEPWWRVVCLRKQYRSKYNLTPEDEKKTWRQITYEDSEDKKTIIKTIKETNPPQSITMKTVKKTQKVRQVYEGDNGRIHKTQWIKKEPEYTLDIISHEQTDLNIVAESIDVCFRKDEPVDLEIMGDSTTKTIWGIKSDRTIKPINYDGIVAMNLNDLRKENIRLNEELSMVMDELDKYKKMLHEQMNRVDMEVEDKKTLINDENVKLRIMDDECLLELKKINHDLKKNLTMKEIIIKYHSLQYKLNESMTIVKKICKKCFDNDDFDIDGKIKELGFVMMVPRLIDYLVSIIKLDDDYIEEYE